MTGLDKILNQIKEESTKNAENIIAEAKKKADEIKKSAEEKACSEFDFIISKAKEDAKIINQRAKSSKELKNKQNILIKKQELISSLLDKAKNTILSFNVDEYFSFMKKILDKLPENGVICFNSKDLKRLNEPFKAYLSDKNFIISNDTVNINGGCIVKYGDIEENCSLEALFESKKDVLTDKVSKLIFG